MNATKQKLKLSEIRNLQTGFKDDYDYEDHLYGKQLAYEWEITHKDVIDAFKDSIVLEFKKFVKYDKVKFEKNLAEAREFRNT